MTSATRPTPSASPTSAPGAASRGLSVDDLAYEIARLGGAHPFGTSALAEALLPFLRANPCVQPVATDTLVTTLKRSDGSASDFVVRTHHTAPQSNEVFVDVQRQGAEPGEIALALTVGTQENGEPYVAVHDSGDDWVTTLHLQHDGRVHFRSNRPMTAAA